VATDVTDPAAVEELKQRVLDAVGPARIVVNAAGLFGPTEFVKDSDPNQWVAAIMVDAIAPYLVSRAFVGGMIAAGWGRIVNITSAASLHPPGALNSAYGTAKAALNQFTRHLAAELVDTGVTANVLHPGDVKTDMWADVRDRVLAAGPAAEAYQQRARWVDETGGDPRTRRSTRCCGCATTKRRTSPGSSAGSKTRCRRPSRAGTLSSMPGPGRRTAAETYENGRAAHERFRSGIDRNSAALTEIAE